MKCITVSGLSKAYRIGKKSDHSDSLIGTLAESIKAPFRNLRRLQVPMNPEAENAEEVHWALRDVSFEVKEGDVLGVIGRNGAGKSTLLKILSRITEPTAGEVKVRGRVASLLEVGTGFHPELTGRENVYLNGTILGMRKAEIDRKFDEIVSFSGVERFLDTPIKRYSSGMKVRLAFSVAAHLEPEILVIDEVLAVGDTDFQKRCIGKMQSVATTGRTVLFVSHNLGAMRALCTKGLLLSDGVVAYSGEINEALKYYSSRFSIQEQSDLRLIKSRQGTGDVRFTEINFISTNASGTVGAGDGLCIDLKLESNLSQGVAEIAIGFYNSDGVKIAWIGTRLTGVRVELTKGICAVRCSLPEIPLMPDYYSVTLHVSVGGEVSDWMQNVAGFEIVEGDFYGTGQKPPGNWGVIMLRQNWCML